MFKKLCFSIAAISTFSNAMEKERKLDEVIVDTNARIFPLLKRVQSAPRARVSFVIGKERAIPQSQKDAAECLENILLKRSSVASFDSIDQKYIKSALSVRIGEEKETMLHSAVRNNHLEFVIKLQNAGAEHKKNARGEFPVHYAAAYSPEILRYFSKVPGFNMAPLDDQGQTPLFFAKSMEALTILEGCGLSLFVTNSAGQCPLFAALKNRADNEVLVKMALAMKRAGRSLKDVRDNENNSLLHCGAAFSDDLWVDRLVGEGISVDDINRAGDTPLSAAVVANNLQTGLHLLKKEADVNKGNHNGETPLYKAVDLGHKKFVKHLLRNDANPTVPGKQRRTPLHVALEKYKHGDEDKKQERLDIIGFLLAAGAEKDFMDNNYKTPLKQAETAGTQVLGLFHSVNAIAQYRTVLFPSEETSDTESTSSTSIAEGVEEDIARYILEQLKLPMNAPLSDLLMKVDKLDQDGEALIHRLIKLRKTDALKVALHYLKANANVRSKAGWIPLHYAALYCPEAIDCLIEFGADINETDGVLRTPTHFAVITGNMPALRQLLIHKPNLEARAQEGTALYIAAEQGLAVAVELLLAEGARDERVTVPMGLRTLHDLTGTFNGKGQQGSHSPLEIAIKNNHTEVVKVFAKHKQRNGLSGQFYAAAFEPRLIIPFHECGCSVKVIDRKRRTPLHYACPEAVGTLLRLEANPEALDEDGCAPIHLAAGSDEESLAVYSKVGKWLDLPDARGCTPIFHAIEKHHWKNFMALYKRCNTGVCTTLGESLLHWALKYQNIQVAEFFIKQRRFINEPTTELRTPLLYAVKYCPQLIKSLVEAGADKEVQDVHGYKMIHLAAAENAAALSFIIEHCGVDVLDSKQRTALMIADQECNVQAIRFLLSHGANVTKLTVVGSCQRTRLQYLVQYMPQHAQKMLSKLTDQTVINEVDAHGRTVVHYATLFNPELLEGLHKAGADFSKADGKGYTPFALAFLFNKQAMVHLVRLGIPPVLPQFMISATPPHIAGLERHKKKPNEFVRNQTLGYGDDLARLKSRGEEVLRKSAVTSTRGYTSQSTEKK